MYRISYTYDSPSNAGPFKGHTMSADKLAKGHKIRAPFGVATVSSSRLVGPYRTGDGKRFATMEDAIQHAETVARRTGNVISVERR